MTSGQVFLLAITAWVSIFAAGLLFGYIMTGQPPRHCRYLVPVAAHPHVLGCSEYPRPQVRP